MQKTSSFLISSIKAFAASLTGAVAFCAIFYCAIASDDQTWPSLSADGLARWEAFCLWISGAAIVMFAFLLFKNVLKRRNFDLDTVGDETNVIESWPTWLLKTSIGYFAAVAVILGGTLLFIPVLHISWKDYLSDFRLAWIEFIGGLFGVSFPIAIVGRMIRRWWRKRKLAKRKPAHLA